MVTCIWFDDQAEEVANYYTSVFPNSKITRTILYPEAAQEVSGKKPGSIMTVEFEINGTQFMALNGGQVEGFKLSPATSFIINCDSQEEIDELWEKLSAVPEAEQCGWCTDKFGVTWQITPTILDKYMADPDPQKVESVTKAFLNMKKLEIAPIQEAYDKA